MKKILFSLSAFLFFIFASAQDMDYAREVVETLASEEFHGRGYIDKGDAIAADYIQTEFEKFGLNPFGKSYMQEFTTPVNTFPKALKLVVDGEAKEAGVDFLVEAGSPSVKGKFKTVFLSAEDLLDKNKFIPVLRNSSGKFIVTAPYKRDDYSKEDWKSMNEVVSFIRYGKDIPAAGSLILTYDKLTWSGSTSQHANPSFTLLVDENYQEVRKIEVEAESKFINKYQSQNVVGYLEGEKKDSMIVFVAHYDHLGKMGPDVLFPGANDNASGTAMLLNLAKYYANNNPKYTTVFIAFGGEEIGLVGSKYFSENPLFELEKIKFLINFDLAGTGDDGIQVVNGKIYQKKFDRLVTLNEENDLVPKVKIRGEACNSDHCMFHRKGVPCFYIYTLGGIKAYHDVNDKAETLPLTEFADYFKLVTLFIGEL